MVAVAAGARVVGRWPTAGWGWFWVGDPDSGFGREQPGGFFYNCLPYLEQQVLHDLQSGTVRGSPAQLPTSAMPCGRNSAMPIEM